MPEVAPVISMVFMPRQPATPRPHCRGTPNRLSRLATLWEIFRVLGEGTGFYPVGPDIEKHHCHTPITLSDFVIHRSAH